MSLPLLWRVAVDAPLSEALTYEIPEAHAIDSRLRRGQSVVVPLGKRKVTGVLLGPQDLHPETLHAPAAQQNANAATTFKIKPIIDFDAERASLDADFVSWLEWLAHYYIHPIGQVFATAFPPLPPATERSRQRKSSIINESDLLGHNEHLADPRQHAHHLTDEQRSVLARIEAHPGFGVHLVHGVTGSGKTEIYLQLLKQQLAAGKQAVLLVPEISLTPQLLSRFVHRFGDAIAVIHSHLTPREKTNQWWQMLSGEKKILIGARSALFCPIEKLGMIILDEEHESSYKQDEKLKYHARDAAIMLGKFKNCPVILGSATPSLESWTNAKTGRFHLHTLLKRVEDRQMPDIEVIDLREKKDRYGEAHSVNASSSAARLTAKQKAEGLPFWLSAELKLALTETLSRGEQSALFLNRRGVAQSVLCPDCGATPECPNCAVSLTLHGRSSLVCHYCDYHETLSEVCKECHEGTPKPIGLGTELIETDLQKLFPEARLIRMDRDEISSREDLETSIQQIERGEVDILIGTQMIAKGLDFEKLTTVGLVLADVAFNLPDFRASERSFQLLTQVAGRAGRHLKTRAGQVIIQTFNPDHPSIQFAIRNDYEGFAAAELMFREQLQYPPKGRLTSFRISGADLHTTESTADLLGSRAEQLKGKSADYAAIEILGPAPAPLAKLRNQYRFHLLVKGPDARHLGQFARRVLGDLRWVPPKTKILVDVDALNLL